MIKNLTDSEDDISENKTLITFDRNTSQSTLDFSYKQYNSIRDGIFNGLNKLENLYLNDNRFYSLNYQLFRNLVNLKVLKLNNNKLNSLDDKIFEGLSNLKELHLNNNELTLLELKIFNGLNNLECLFLHKNKISVFYREHFNCLSYEKIRVITLYSRQFISYCKDQTQVVIYNDPDYPAKFLTDFDKFISNFNYGSNFFDLLFFQFCKISIFQNIVLFKYYILKYFYIWLFYLV